MVGSVEDGAYKALFLKSLAVRFKTLTEKPAEDTHAGEGTRTHADDTANGVRESRAPPHFNTSPARSGTSQSMPYIALII
ncbi:hypothetical protein KGM_204356 [Danaus plexippus plexippus]|uniref:Uncharacterized protein n=1 Tax=Danaus plexippus plexippus TaxID=278856 RepID=A0A212FBJ5_DANPL|nr:hypothetical protein KGM_204356 [Danaus plexippus plexippus]